MSTLCLCQVTPNSTTSVLTYSFLSVMRTFHYISKTVKYMYHCVEIVTIQHYKTSYLLSVLAKTPCPLNLRICFFFLSFSCRENFTNFKERSYIYIYYIYIPKIFLNVEIVVFRVIQDLDALN